MLAHAVALSLILPSLVSAALFPPDSLVKQIDVKGFKNAMKENRTSVVAFVAPWCGHCQRMVPELSKAALGLYPLIPVYAVDCDADKNKRLCAEQGVQGFPTVKLFPRGKSMAPVLFDGPQRSASAFFYFAERRVPHKNKKLYQVDDIKPWINKNVDKDRVLLLSKSKKVPLLWQVLANKYRDDFAFGSHRDRKGKGSVSLGFEVGEKKESKVLVYPKGSTTPVRFEGILKFDSLSKFFESVIDGTIDLSVANKVASEEEYQLTPEEEEIERQQEAQRIALAHGGFEDLIDFEEAIKVHGMDFHDSHGYGGAMGGMPKKKDKNAAPAAGAEDGAKEDTKAAAEGEAAKEPKKAEKPEDPIHRILKAQKEREEKARTEKETPMPKTGDGEQVVMEAPTATATATASDTTATADTPEEAEPEPAQVPIDGATEEAARNAVDETDTPAVPEPAPEPETTPEAGEPERKHDEL